jgi:putative nucleotidyltransferase with HDIG domain
MPNDRLEAYLAEAKEELPTVPAVAAQIIDALDDPEASLDDVRELIERDPALATRILRVSNSSMYSFPTEIQSLGQAMSLIGARSVRNLVMAVAMRETYQSFGTLERLLWEHAMSAGPAAAGLAKKLGVAVDPDECFMAGLLHDIGKTALANSHREEYEAVFERIQAESLRSVDAERDAFGFDHAELGARVAESWSLPPRVISVIRHHHDPAALEKLPEPDAKETALVEVASGCLTRLGAGRQGPVAELDVCALPGWKFLGTDDALLEDALAVTGEQVEAAAAFSA